MGSTALAAAALLTSCAFNRPLFTETITNPTNGIVTVRSLRVTTFALWPATTQLEKQRASLGKTFSLGTTGLSEDGGGTNLATAVEALTGLVRALKQ